MIKEGFTEDDIIGVVQSGRLLENYPEEASSATPLHVLCDHSNKDAVDIVTAYIPQKPWWRTETKRGRIQ